MDFVLSFIAHLRSINVLIYNLQARRLNDGVHTHTHKHTESASNLGEYIDL